MAWNLAGLGQAATGGTGFENRSWWPDFQRLYANSGNSDPNAIIAWQTAAMNSGRYPDLDYSSSQFLGRTVAGLQSNQSSSWGDTVIPVAAGLGIGAGVLGGLGAFDPLISGAAGGAASGGATAGAAGDVLAGAGDAFGSAADFGLTSSDLAAMSAAGGATAGAIPGVGDAGAFDQFGSAQFPGAGDVGAMGSGSIFGDTVGVGDAGAFDQFGSTAIPGAAASGSIFDAGIGSGGLWDTLKQYGGAGLNALKDLFAGNASGGGTGGFGGGPTVGSTAPGLLALAYAAKQPGIDLTNLNSILGKLGGNQDAIVKAATDPVQANIAAGYGDLLQNQANRGIRGSSFGATDIGNYLSNTSNTLGNVAANASQGSLALQGNLATNIENLRNQAQQIKNNLYGRAFDVLGRGLNPAGYAGSRVGP